MGDFSGLPTGREVDAVLELVEELEVRRAFVDALEELLLFDVVARSVPLGHRVELHRPPRHHCSEAVGVVGDLLAQVALDRLQDLVVHPALGPAL